MAARRRKRAAVAGVVVIVLAGGVVHAQPAQAATECARGYVALTFDDGPHGSHTPAMLDALRRRKVPATFFVVGSRVAQRPDLVRREAHEGHAVANHTWAHANMTRQSDAAIRDTIRRTERQIIAAGARPTKLVRPPYGVTNARVAAAIRSAGYRQMLWTIDPQDWRSGRSAATISNGVLSRLHGNAVVVLHDGVANSSNTVRALPAIIDGARARGYCFGVLDDRGAIVAKAPHGTRPAIVRGSLWAMRRSLDAGPADVEFSYGRPSDVPLLCDWNGDGTSTPAMFRAGAWYLRNSLSGGRPDLTFRFGVAGDVPVCGDWNGDGRETVGVVRGNVWHLRNRNSAGGAHLRFQYGQVGDVPVVGDWNGNGVDTVGVVRGNVWHLRNRNSAGGAHASFAYGRAGDRPVVGDWNGNGMNTVGVVRGRTWLLRNEHSAGRAQHEFAFGQAGDRPLAWK